MITAATQHRYVSEAIWLPTYLGVSAVVLGTINSSAIAAVFLLVAPIGSRFVLEFIYRVVFGDARLQWRIGIAAFVTQLVIWGLLATWYLQKGGA